MASHKGRNRILPNPPQRFAVLYCRKIPMLRKTGGGTIPGLRHFRRVLMRQRNAQSPETRERQANPFNYYHRFKAGRQFLSWWRRAAYPSTSKRFDGWMKIFPTDRTAFRIPASYIHNFELLIDLTIKCADLVSKNRATSRIAESVSNSPACRIGEAGFRGGIKP